VVPDIPVTPPTAFSIIGVTGPADTTQDLWLMGTPNPTVNFTASMGAQGYEITVYEEDGTTVKCPTQQAAGTATSSAFPMCTLTEGLQYRASVVATAGMFRTAASNDKARFAVGAVVFGQPNANRNEGVRLGMTLPNSVIFVGTKLIVADQNNSRVLIWNTVPTANHQQADVVLGQPDFSTATPSYGGISARNFQGSNSVASDGTKLIVGDRFNHRVLIWNTIPTTNYQPADVVIGQPDFTTGTSNTGGISASSMDEPCAWVGGTKLFVADRLNIRVLVWNTIPTTNGVPADLVLGQPNFTSAVVNNGGLSASSMADPLCGWSDGTRVFLPDHANHRVLVWNALPSATNAAADLVLGQSSMMTNSPNLGGTVGLGGLNGPVSVYANANLVAVADYLNNRVALWTSPITTNGQPANIILGQSSATGGTANAGGLSASSMNGPNAIASDGTRLAIADRFNMRVLLYPTVPAMTGAPASLVLGQPDMVSNRLNNGGPVSASSLSAPDGISMLGTRFGVADTGSRVLLWNAPPTSRLDLPNVVIGQPNFTSSGQFGGTTTASSLCGATGMHSDGTRLFVGEQCANRVTIWNTLPNLTHQPADLVVGQPDMMTATQNTGGVSAHSLFGRQTPYSDGTRLFVSDTRNHRILIWNAIPTANAADANVVLGQPDMTSNTANNGGVSATSLNFPGPVYVSGGKLFVSDTNNHRVLIWNAIPTLNRTAADVVLGQPNMTTNTVATTTSSMTLTRPNGIHVDAMGRLYVADPGNSRILYWNTVPTVNQTAASGVIGQPNMDVGLANNGGLTARTLQSPNGMMSNGTLLYVLDSGNDRMLLLPRP
jgi:sugar lactone lactonase YvrE